MRLSIASIFFALLGTACGGGGGGKIMADTSVLPYVAPDVDELTGIDSEADDDDSDTEDEESEEGTAPAPAPAQPTK